jgi:hypothetical protein
VHVRLIVMVVKVRVWGSALLALAFGASCSVYPDQEVQPQVEASAADLASGQDTYTVVIGYDLAAGENTPGTFPEALSLASARLANPQATSFDLIQDFAKSCKPELPPDEWEKFARFEMIRWSDGLLQVWLMFSDATEKKWDVVEFCKGPSAAAPISTKSRP